MSDGLPPIKGFLPTTLIEWEGQIACALFLPGCNFRCPFCHATDLVRAAAHIETIPFDAVTDQLDRNEGWIDGVVISGGEPTLHRGLADLIVALREHTPAVKLDTNGSMPDVVKDLTDRGLIDFVAMDIKAPLGEKYHETAGVRVDLDAVQATIALLSTSGIPHEFRTTIVPGLHNAADVVEIARLLGAGERLILQQFAPLNCLDVSYTERRPYTRDELRTMAATAAEFLAECRLRGDAASGAAKP